MASVKLGFENDLWSMADKLRGNIESSEYKHVILGLVFLKYISDSFEERYEELQKLYPGTGIEEDRDAYSAANVFFVPKEARWEFIKSYAKLPTIGEVIDNAMITIERENSSLKNVLPKNYARPELDKIRLGEMIDLFSFDLGGKEARAKDVLGRVYEYFLNKFGSSDGEFYTPPSVVKLLVNMIEPYRGRVYDPCCGSGGMFVQSAEFIKEHQGKLGDISIYGQEYTATTWRLAKMNLAIRGIEANLGKRDADTFTNDQHKNLRADFIIANPPFNQKDWGHNHLVDDRRWMWGIPSPTNANYAWISHMLYKLSSEGIAAFLLSSISTTSEDEIREKIVKEDLVKVMITLPPNLFYKTPTSPVVWVVSKKKSHSNGKVLFIDLSNKGDIEKDSKKTFLNNDTIDEVSTIVKDFLTNSTDVNIKDLCIVKSIDELEETGYNLTPQRYIEYTEEKIVFEKNIKELKKEITIDIEKSIDEMNKLIYFLEELDD